MKTLTTFISLAIYTSISIVSLAQADELMDIIHPESADLFDHSSSFISSNQVGIVNLNDSNENGSKVWSFEYEEYVDSKSFGSSSLDINAYIKENPTAAGRSTDNVMKWNETAGEYHLQ